MRRMKRLIAGFLCMVMLLSSVPLEALAAETTDETQSIETLLESVITNNSETEETVAETESTEATESETESTEVTESETEATEATESETESTEATESETESTEATESETESTEATESEIEATEEVGNGDDEPRWLYYVNADGYAVIEGYTDYEVTELSIPYTIDDYYVVAIDEKAFVNNIALSKMYIHGNVQTIAANAFDGLGVVLVGYNGTTVMSYASQNGYDFRLKSDQDYFTFKDIVIDFSYVEGDRYSYVDATTVKMAMPEALQLSVGDVFFLPKAYDDLLGVYEVLSVEVNDGYAVITVQDAAYEDVLASLSISNEQLQADWSQAEWEDGVEILEEKWSSTAEGFISIGYEKELGKKKVSWPGSDGSKVVGESGAKFFIEGSLNLKATANVDIDIGWFSADVKDLSLILEPSVNVKTGIKFDIFDNEAVNTKTPIEMVKPQDYTYKIGSVPLVSASGVITVKVAIYAKVSASGEVTLSFGGSGELGFKWNNSKDKFEGVNKWKWNTPTINGSVKLEVGPCFAVELHCAVLGKVVSLELFAGGVLEAKATVNFGAGGSTDVNTGQTSSTELGICADLDVDGKISLTLKLELELLKDIIKTGGSWELFCVKKDIWEKHWELRSGFVGFLDECTYETTNTVQFCTFTADQIASLEVMYNATFPEPTIEELPDNKLLGWYTDKNYTNQWDFENDKVTSDMTLYAKWEKSNKTVVFVTQNEEVGAADWTAQYVPGSNISEPALKIMHWRMNGWYLDEELTDQWDFTKDVMPNEDLTLYGSWTYDETYNPYSSSSDKNYTISDGKLYYNGHVYQHVASYELFSAARADAESQGAYLVTISSQEEMEAVLDYVQDDCAQETLWLGINSTTDWKYWLNGEKMTYWNGSDPETSSSQYNGIFYRADGTWDTYDNGSTSHYIMEWGDYEVDPGFAEYASSSTDGSAHYSTSDDGESVSVVGFADGEEVNISNIYDGLLVTEIEAYAFRNNTSVKSITIPSTVETIGEYAFAGCTSLEEIVIPASVTSIGVNAFDGCTSLKKVILPDGITVLPEYIFRGCTSLEEILNTDDLTDISRYAFYGCTALNSFTAPSKLTTIGSNAFCGCTSLEKLVLNSDLVTIGSYAFSGCTKLSGSITISENCTSIGYDAFYGCSSLEHVFLLCDESVIGGDAFAGVNAVFHGKTEDGIDTWCEENNKEYVSVDGTFRVHFYTTLSTNSSVEAGVKDETLVDDVYLTTGDYITEPTITMEGYVLEGWYVDSDFTTKWDFARDKVEYEDITLYANWVEETSVFTYYVEAGNAYISEYNGSDENVIIPSTLGGCDVVGIAAGAFTSVDSVNSVAIPDSVSVIEANAFSGCLNLYTITFPNGNDNFSIVSGVLYSADMTELIYAAEARTFTKFVVPDGVERIYGGAFKNHGNLTSVEIPESVIEIGEAAFPTSSFLTIYGPDSECAAKIYANDNGLGYNEYLVTFYDGDRVLFSSVITTGELLIEYTDFESEYATYAGWYRDSACTDPWDFATDTMPAGNLSLYLKWDSDFAVEEGTDGLVITQYVGSNSAIVIPEEINGSVVAGIAADAFVSTSDVPIASITVPDCVITIADNAISGDPAPTIIADADSAAAVYAEAAGLAFEKRAYTISFEVNGGVEIAPMTLVPGEVPVLPTPVKSNNYFLGWYTTNFYTTQWAETDVMPAENITLYARWQVINSQISNDFSFDVMEDGTAVITGYHGTKTALSIPSSINGYTVTAVGDFAFAENKTVLTIIIPETVQSFGEFAFANSAIMTITGGNGVVSLGESCFSGASALRTPFIPAGVTEIPDYCFEYCNAFTDVIIPDNITAIGNYAFYGCNYLNSVEISETVTRIGTGAFAGCKNLATVDVPSTLSGVDEAIFGSAEINYYAASVLKILSVKQLTKASVQLSWNEIDNADGYKLYRKQGTSGSYALIKTITGTSTSNYSLTSGVTYYYKVVAYQETEAGTTILAESSEYMIRIARLSTPSVSAIQVASSDSATMTWASVVGAEGYEIWRAYELDGEYSLLKTVTGTETINSGLVGGRSYFYKVRAFYDDDGTTEYSAFSEVYQFTMPLLYVDVPENVTVRQTASGTVLLEWDTVENADGYNVYRKRGNGALAFVKTTLSTSTYNYNLVEGETYGYVVEAYSNTDKGTIIGQKSDVVSVTIASLATPYIKSVSQSAVKTALVNWTSISAADGYELWRSRTEDGTYSLMKSVTGTATSNYNLTVGGTYYYKVRAYVVSESGEYEYSSYSNAVPITILSVAKTRLKSVVQADATSAKVTWAYMSGAKSYEVWRSVNDNEHFELIRTTSGTAIQDRNLVDGQTYYYKVRAYDDSGDTIVYGEFSDELYLCIIGAPVIATLEQNGSNSVFITWDKVNDADGYELWRSTDGSNYSSVKSVVTASTYNYSLTVGETYYYKVRAYKTVDGTKVYGNYSKAVAVKILGAPDVTSLLQNGSNGVKLAWSGDDHADGYELWRSLTEDNGVFTKVKNVTGTSTTSFGLYETVATYKLRSYATVNGKKVYGPFGDAMSITILGTPTFKEGLQASTSSVSLVWNEVEGATSYKVYRSSSPDSGFTLIKTVTGTETKTYSLQSGNTYYFKLKAVMNENGIAHEGAYSEAIEVYVSDIVAPYIKNCKQTSDGITITATINGTVDGIELWRADDSGEYTQITDSTTNVVSDTTSYGGETYKYKIRSYVIADDVRVYSAFSSAIEFGSLATPTLVRAAQTDSSTVYLEWDLVEGATKYEVSRSTDEGESYTTIGIFEGNSATDSVITEGSYLYRIRACATEGSNTNYSYWSSGVTATVAVYSDDVYPETAHDYSNYLNQIFTYTKEGAEALSLTFSSSSYTESGYDYIYVLDGNGQCVARLSGSIGGTTLVTAGDTFQLYFTTDGSGTNYGFSFDSIAEASLDDVTDAAYSWRISGNKVYVDGSSDLSVFNNRSVFSHVTEVEVVSGTTSLSASMLEGMTNITKVTLPDGLTSIGAEAFYGCTGITEINIPDSVTSIGNYAFYRCTSITDIDLPDGVTSIGNYAFYYCTGLKTIELPKSLTNIGEYAFAGCTGITNLTIPDTVTNIDVRAFDSCTALTSVYIPAELQSASVYYNYNSSSHLAWGIFNGCTNLTNVTFEEGTDYIHGGLFAGSGLKTITIPDTVTGIGSYAFANCENLENITLPANLSTIGEYAFCYCTSIKNVSIPDTITDIGTGAYENCTALTDVYIPAEVQAISIHYSYNTNSHKAWGIFNGCTKLTNVMFEEGTDYIHGGLFAGSGLKSLVIPDTVTGVGSYAFANCASLTTITLPAQLSTIGEYAFCYSTSLKSITIPDAITEVGIGTFENCTALTNVYLPAELQSATVTYSYNTSSHKAWGIFNGCSNLTNVTFEEGTDYIHGGLFAGSGLKSITIPDTVTGIGSYAFANCASLETVTMPASLTSIGDYGFSYCTSLKSFALPEGITSIGAYTFANCSQLTNVTFEGNALTSLGTYGFANATGLESINLPDSITSIADYAFYGCTNLKEAPLNENITSIGSYAFANCSALTEISLPTSLTTISARAFENCTGLTDLFVPATFGSVSTAYSSGKGVFNGCTALTNITFEEGITKIPDGAFAGSGIREIAIPETVTEIGSYAFSYCTKLRKMDLPEGLTTINSYAFQYCSILKRFTLPSTVTTLGSYAFQYCYDLTSVTIPTGVDTINSYLFRNCTSLNTVVISGSVTTINDYAFYGCSSLKNITIPGTVTTISSNAFKGLVATTAGPIGGGYDYEFGWTEAIPANAFRGTSNLTSVVIPEGITTIGNNAFYESGLTTITLPDTVTTVGTYCFNNCDSLTEATWSAGATTIPERCFNDCDALTSVVIPEGVTTINTRAFYSCGALKNVTMPSTVTSIASDAFQGIAATSAGPVGGEYDYQFAWTESIPANAFRGISSLTSAIIPEGITSIGGSAFYEAGLTSIVLPSSATTVGTYCFNNCDSLTDVTWSANAATVPERCFYDCDALTSVVIPEGVTTINARAFYSCDALKNVTMPSTVTSIASDTFQGIAATSAGPVGGEYDYQFAWAESIPANAFRGTSSLTSVIIPDGITTIGGSAFYESGLVSISLPSSVTTVGTYCFNNCDSLTDVTWSANATTVPERCFYDCDALTSVVIPEGVTSIGYRAFYGSGNLQNITVPGTITSISDGAFNGVAVTTVGPIGGGYDYEFGWTETIPSNAFREMSKLTSAVIPEGVNKLGSYAFYSSGLTSVSLPSTLLTISDYSFYNCDGLTSIVIPEGTTTIGYRAFYGSNNLKNISMPGTVTSISDGAFNGVAVTTVGPVGGGYDYEFGWTETIPSNAFREMSKLTSVVIPEGITSIGSYAFYSSSLTSISLPSTLTAITTYCFYNCDGLTSIVIPEGVTSIGYRAFYNSGNLAAITVPDTVTAIDSGAFSNCSSSLILYCADDSYAATYADANGFTHQQP